MHDNAQLFIHVLNMMAVLVVCYCFLYSVNLWLLKYLNQEVVEEVVFRCIMFTYLKVNAPTQVELVVEYSHIHVSSVYCTRTCPKPLGWSEEEGKLVWDRTSAECFL